MEKVAKKAAALFVCVLFIFSLVHISAFATGSYSVSATSLTVTQGSSKTFTFSASNAVGAFEISTDGGVSASCSGETWVDNSSVTITVTGNTVGTGHVYISVYDGADYDGNDLSGKSYTVTVTVKSASGGTVSETTTVSQTEATTAAATTTTEETTTEDPETELLTVTIGEAEYLIVKDLSDEELPEGFTLEEVVYNTVTVQVMVFEDIVIYVLEDEDGGTDYYTLGSSFELLRYTYLDESLCIFLDMPENLEIPYGYSITETEIFGCTVEALVMDQEEAESQEETSDETQGSEESTAAGVSAAAFFTVGVSEGDEDEDEDADADADGGTQTAAAEEDEEDGDVVTVADMLASSEGHYYVYCLLSGQKVLCDYDSSDESLRMCTAVAEVETEEETQEETEPETAAEVIEEDEESGTEQILIICLIAAGAVIIALAVILIIVLAKGRKKDDDNDFGDLIFEEEDVFEQRAGRPAAKSFAEAAENDVNAENEPDEEDYTSKEVYIEGTGDDADEETASEGSREDEEAQAGFGNEDNITELSEDDLSGTEAFTEGSLSGGEAEAAEDDYPEDDDDDGYEASDISKILSEEFEDIMKYVDGKDK